MIHSCSQESRTGLTATFVMFAPSLTPWPQAALKSHLGLHLTCAFFLRIVASMFISTCPTHLILLDHVPRMSNNWAAKIDVESRTIQKLSERLHCSPACAAISLSCRSHAGLLPWWVQTRSGNQVQAIGFQFGSIVLGLHLNTAWFGACCSCTRSNQEGYGFASDSRPVSVWSCHACLCLERTQNSVASLHRKTYVGLTGRS